MWFLRRPWAAVVVCVLVGCTVKQTPEPIQVAHLLPLTGPDKKAAEDAQRGMMFAVEAVNAEDQRVGGRSVVVRNIDTVGDPEMIQAETVRLVTLNKVVAFVAGLDSHAAEQLVRATQTYNLPVVVRVISLRPPAWRVSSRWMPSPRHAANYSPLCRQRTQAETCHCPDRSAAAARRCGC